MSDERDLTRIEDLLRSVPTPMEVPARYAPVAKAAALGEPAANDVVTPVRSARRPRRWFAAAAVLAGAVAAAVAIGVIRNHSSPMYVQESVALKPGSPAFAKASGSIDLGRPDGAMRPAVLRVQNLQPAPSGEYYEMWFSSGDDTVGMMAFNTETNGMVTVRSAVPAGMRWTRCWVTLERESGGTIVQRPVLRSS
jgi:hypothetical protein